MHARPASTKATGRACLDAMARQCRSLSWLVVRACRVLHQQRSLDNRLVASILVKGLKLT